MNETPPKNNSELKYSQIAPEVIKNLQALKRTGWVRRGVKNPESVYEHTVALRNLVVSEINNLTDFSTEEKQEILDMLEIHDWPESDPNVGDIVIMKTDPDREISKKEKSQLELEAIKKICEKLGDKGQRILELWMKFENGQDSLSSFAHQVDKLQAMEKAFEYEISGETVSTQDFISHDEHKIIHPILIKRLQALKEKLTRFKAI